MNILITLLAVVVLILTLLGTFGLTSQRLYPGKKLAVYIARDGLDVFADKTAPRESVSDESTLTSSAVLPQHSR